MKRIAIGQFLQETNTFNPLPTQGADFEAYGLAREKEIVARYGEVGELAGFMALPELLGESVEWLGLVRAVACSGGPLQAGLLEEMMEEMMAPLRQSPIDGVLLSLHGAQAAVDEPDVAGRVLAAVRRQVGRRTPVVATLDLHANLTPRMVYSADLLVGYHTFPHVDQEQSGRRAARGLARLLKRSIRPQVRAWKIPMVVNTEGRATDRGIQQELWRKFATIEEREEVFSVGLYMVQPWFDVPFLGWTLYQAYEGEEPPFPLAEIAQQCWETRHHRQIEYLAPEEVVAAARQIRGRPVVVSEGHDATNSGAPGDSTLLMEAMVRQPIGEGGGLCFCVDPEAVGRCLRAGQGARLALEIGGRRDPFSSPLAVEGVVEALGELRYRLSGHGGHNLPVDMGRMARVRRGDTVVVLTERTGPGSSPLLYRAAGVEPRDFKLVVAKSPEGFRQDYESFAAGILYCGAPGCATPFLSTLEFKAVHRPLFPQDELEEMAEAKWAGLIAAEEIDE